MHQTSPHTGFSLVELSIVLVILGLLVGGVLGGRNLIKAAELRAITTEQQQWQTAVNTFKQKYFALPGDMHNATQFWPDATVNGDGNGRIGPAEGTTFRETVLFWQHLALGGLINGEYTGDGVSMEAGVNAPSSSSGHGAWFAEYFDNTTNSDMHFMAFFAVNYGHALELWGSSPHALTPEEAWSIDRKIDDGKPAQGSVYGLYVGANGCTTTSDWHDLDADYNLNASGSLCDLYFANAF